MRLRSLFTVPEGHKVTERYLHRVLIFSICSIFLCMSCLAGVTWAWFGVSVENTGNEIWIGEPAITLNVDDAAFTSGSWLTAAEEEYIVQLNHANESDDLDKKSVLYVTFTIDSEKESIVRYVTLNEQNEYAAQFAIQAEVACKLSWEVSWMVPPSAEELTETCIVVKAPEPATEPTTEATEPPTEATEPPTEGTEPPTEGTEPPTEATEPPTEATEPPTEAPEPSTEATESSAEEAEPEST